MRMRNLLFVLLFAGIISYAIYEYARDSRDRDIVIQVEEQHHEIEVGTKVGQRAPDITLKDLKGEDIRLSDYRGKMVIVNFWASWCGPCREEMPDLQRIHEEVGDRVVVLAVNLTTSEFGVDRVHKFAEKLGLDFPIVLDVEGDAASDYRIIFTPTTYVVDEEGVIRERVLGQLNDEKLQQMIDRRT